MNTPQELNVSNNWLWQVNKTGQLAFMNFMNFYRSENVIN